MFFEKDRLPVVRRWILRGEDIEKVQEFQRTDFREIMHEMDGLPVTVRLLDPPLHEFLPQASEVTDQFAKTLNYPDAQTLKKDIADMHEGKKDHPFVQYDVSPPSGDSLFLLFHRKSHAWTPWLPLGYYSP